MKGKFLVIHEKEFNRLVEEVINRVTKRVKPSTNTKNADQWIDGKEAKQLLGIKSNGKLNNLSKDKHITLSQHGRTKMYCRQSILDFLERSKI